MRKQLLLLLFSVLMIGAQARTISGVVTSSADGEPVIGATVQVKGTNRGTATDFDGKYTVEANDGETLSISYVGMEPTTVKVVAGKSTYDIVLKENSQVLSEVVVTAYGQTQEKKKLNFAVQTLNSDQITAGASNNFANSLQGKVAGLQVGTGGGSPNSDTQIVIRAISSVNNSQSNQPLMVVDGVAIRGATANSLADINPDDILNVNVLKGAAASALYGQEGANGVIMITTKSGSRNGTVEVNASASIEISNCMRIPKVQRTFIPGSKGFYKENSASGGWGPYLSATDKVYDNVGDFLGTGLQQRYSLSVSGGTEKFNSYASVAYTMTDGVVPKDYKKQLTLFLKGQYKPSDKVTIQMSLNFVDSRSRGFGNSMSTLYAWAINKNMSDYKTEDGTVNWASRYDNWDALTNLQRLEAGVSPYFGRYRDWSESHGNRIMFNGQIAYEPIKDLVFTGKVGYDTGFSTYEASVQTRFVPSDFIEFERSLDDTEGNEFFDKQFAERYQANLSRWGEYQLSPSRSYQVTAQFFANYAKTFAEDYTVNVFYGMEYRRSKGLSAKMGGYQFILEDFNSFTNINPETYLQYAPYINHTTYDKYGYFGEVRFDYKGLVQVSGTWRHDGSSHLKQAYKTSYFYPSFTAGVIFSELFGWKNSWFSFGKLRGNWAKVGKDAPGYLFTSSYKKWNTFPNPGYGKDPTVSYATRELEPEMTSSWEIGTDLHFFDSRTRLDIAYYSTTVDNQIVSVRVSPASGDILQTRNEGRIENHGLEVSLQQDIIRGGDFSWTAFANYSFNRGKVKKLPDDIVEIQGTQYGDIFPVARLGGSTTGISGKDYQRDPDGNVICDVNGYPLIDPAKGNYIGNREPDFLLGIGSTLRYKGATLSFLFDGRCGGDVVNVTGRSLITNGQNHLYDKYRNREIIFKGVVQNPDGTYSPNTTPVVLDQNFIGKYFDAVSSNFIEDGSYIRLSYVTLSYDFSSLLKKSWPIKGLTFTATGRNLFLLTKYTGNDPSILAGVSGGTGAMGIDNYNVPSTRNFNFALKATF